MQFVNFYKVFLVPLSSLVISLREVNIYFIQLQTTSYLQIKKKSIVICASPNCTQVRVKLNHFEDRGLHRLKLISFIMTTRISSPREVVLDSYNSRLFILISRLRGYEESTELSYSSYSS